MKWLQYIIHTHTTYKRIYAIFSILTILNFFITKAKYILGRLKLQFEKCNKATENNYGGRMTRTPEYVTKMMNAFWFPFPRFPPRRYAGAGAHYHKALICQTPEAVCESGVGISVERWELETQGELNIQAGSERESPWKTHPSAVFHARSLATSSNASPRACDINACRCRVSREMEWICQPAEDIVLAASYSRSPHLGSDHPLGVHKWKREDRFLR